jgi:hypothetical protein
MIGETLLCTEVASLLDGTPEELASAPLPQSVRHLVKKELGALAMQEAAIVKKEVRGGQKRGVASEQCRSAPKRRKVVA